MRLGPRELVATLVGAALVFFPEPATTATGLAILGATWAVDASKR